jgi:hypothetical protein
MIKEDNSFLPKDRLLRITQKKFSVYSMLLRLVPPRMILYEPNCASLADYGRACAIIIGQGNGDEAEEREEVGSLNQV